MSARLAFVDCETTGLDPDRHEIWELAIITTFDTTEEWVWQLPVDLSKADPMGLRVGRYYERRESFRRFKKSGLEKAPGVAAARVPVADAAHRVATLLNGTHLVGAVPSFDASFLAPWLRSNGEAPMWHYHLVDVEALAAGKLGIEPPWNSDQLSAKCGVKVPTEDRHTALGDARWARALYLKVLDPADRQGAA